MTWLPDAVPRIQVLELSYPEPQGPNFKIFSVSSFPLSVRGHGIEDVKNTVWASNSPFERGENSLLVDQNPTAGTFWNAQTMRDSDTRMHSWSRLWMSIYL